MDKMQTKKRMTNNDAEKMYVYSADIPPLIYISALFLVQCILFLELKTFFPLLIASVLLLPFLTFCVPYSHHHAHVPMSNSNWLNAYVNRILSLQVWINHYAWKLHHNLGHHKHYTNQYPLLENQKLDESNWSREDGTTMNRMEYTYHLAKSALIRVEDNSQDHPRTFKKYVIYRFQNFTIYAVLFIINPLGLLFIFVIPALIMSVYTFWLTYTHHAGLRSSNPYKASRSITCSIYNFWNTNLGFHTAHHISPHLHWSLLPEFHASIEKNIPKHLITRSILPTIRKKWDGFEYDL